MHDRPSRPATPAALVAADLPSRPAPAPMSTLKPNACGSATGAAIPSSLQSYDDATGEAHRTRAVFRVDAVASGDLTVAALVALLNDLDGDGEVRLAVERTHGVVSGLVIGLRPHEADAATLDLFLSADGADADDAETAADEENAYVMELVRRYGTPGRAA